MINLFKEMRENRFIIAKKLVSVQKRTAYYKAIITFIVFICTLPFWWPMCEITLFFIKKGLLNMFGQ